MTGFVKRYKVSAKLSLSIQLHGEDVHLFNQLEKDFRRWQKLDDIPVRTEILRHALDALREKIMREMK